MEKKYYTFLNANTCVGSNGNEFIGVTTMVTVSNFKDKAVGDTVLVSGRAPISNRSTILSTVLGKEVYHFIRTEVIERRLEKIRLRVNVSAELVPRFGVCEIAATFAGDHDFTARACHLFKNDDTPVIVQSLCGAGSCHESCSTSADNYDICRIVLHVIS